MQPSIFVCPLCRAPLAPDSDNRALRCASGHSFDRAAKGYVHLLPSNRMHTKLPGDSKAMVDARRRFLDAGYYQPFSDAICRILTRELAPSPAPVLLDAGCGEGFYTAAL
ncbi:MAG: 50S rRNA methyltransferase, partial [Oscillospiraceae bacterium]